jgi:hypothetical protein
MVVGVGAELAYGEIYTKTYPEESGLSGAAITLCSGRLGVYHHINQGYQSRVHGYQARSTDHSLLCLQPAILLARAVRRHYNQ